jgi:uncharacterized OsmC-like protein
MQYRAVLVTTSPEGKYRQTVTIGPHVLVADVPANEGGADAGPEPHEWILAGLGTCTAMTLQMYAARKGWKLAKVGVTVTGEHAEGAFVIQVRSLSRASSTTSSARA